MPLSLPALATLLGAGLLTAACTPAPLPGADAGITLSAVPVSSGGSAPGAKASGGTASDGTASDGTASDGTRGSAGPSSAPPARPDPMLSVGPLFRNGIGHPHNCTASVLDSPGQDLLLTAAHCVSGTGQGVSFVPGYAHGTGPYGAWQVVAAYVDPGWLNGHDPADDFAVLRVADQVRDGKQTGVQALTGGNRLGLAPAAGQRVTAIAYDEGLDDVPVRCLTTVYVSAGQPTFDCRGFSNGTSGGPWLAVQPDTGRSMVRGLIGGLHQGGCHDYTSYSPPFTEATFALLRRAESGAPGDTVPAARSDC